jgi:hypothetical protein
MQWFFAYYDNTHLGSEHPLPTLLFLARDPALEESPTLGAVGVAKSKLISRFIHKSSKPLYGLLGLHQSQPSAVPVKTLPHRDLAKSTCDATVPAPAMVVLRPPPKLVTVLEA